MYHFYILYSPSLDSYYVGYTGQTLEERLKKHLSRHRGFTGQAKDWVVFYSETFENISSDLH